jgi:hypothetical protein
VSADRLALILTGVDRLRLDHRATGDGSWRVTCPGCAGEISLRISPVGSVSCLCGCHPDQVANILASAALADANGDRTDRAASAGETVEESRAKRSPERSSLVPFTEIVATSEAIRTVIEHTGEGELSIRPCAGCEELSGGRYGPSRDLCWQCWRKRNDSGDEPAPPASTKRNQSPTDGPRRPAAAQEAARDDETQLDGARSYPAPMRPEAYHGLAGEVVRTLAPHSEADDVALLMHFLLGFGNAIGRGPGLQIEGDFHATNEYAVLVGETAKGRKGTARGRSMQLLGRVDPEWTTEHQRSGLVSGEGLIWEVRDPITSRRRPRRGEVPDGDGLVEDLVDAGVDDKRLMVTEGEFAGVLAATRREGNTLSMVVRDFFDQPKVRTLAKNSPACSTGALVSIIGHITADELRRELTDTAKANGFANRFMFMCVCRSKELPFGGDLDDADLHPLAERVRIALSFAEKVNGSLTWGNDARGLWARVYGGLSEGRPGMVGAVTGRAETHVLKLAVFYALLDGGSVIGLPHIEAGLAVWDYAERSAAYLFGGLTGDSLADRLLDAMRAAGDAGIDRSELALGISHTVKKKRFDVALSYLERRLLAERVVVATGGRSAERWFLKTGKKPPKRERSPDGDEAADLLSLKRGFFPVLGSDEKSGEDGAAQVQVPTDPGALLDEYGVAYRGDPDVRSDFDDGGADLDPFDDEGSRDPPGDTDPDAELRALADRRWAEFEAGDAP